jgi:hypothetical protein
MDIIIYLFIKNCCDAFSECCDNTPRMMTSSRLVRGTKGRLFACLGVLTLFAGVVFLYHSTRVELDVARNSLSKCHQEQDSLAAQVQGKSSFFKFLLPAFEA